MFTPLTSISVYASEESQTASFQNGDDTQDITAQNEAEVKADNPEVAVGGEDGDGNIGRMDQGDTIDSENNDSIPKVENAGDITSTDNGEDAAENRNNKYQGITPEKEKTVVTVKINGTQYGAGSLKEIIETNNLTPSDVKTLKIESGKMTQEDLEYVKELTNLTSFEMNVGENLSLIGKDGNTTTVLSPDTAALVFADKPSGSSKTAIRTVVLGGITEIQSGGLKAPSAETIRIPDAVTVGDSAFSSSFAWLETLDLSSAKTIGKNAFFRCTRLTNLTLNAVETLGEGSFKYTDSLKKLTLPGTIKTIENINFGICGTGNKNGTRLTILAETPPTVVNGAFKGVASSGTSYSTVTVPEGALAAYLAQINPKADVTKVLARKDTIWNNLYLREMGDYLVEYYSPNLWEVQYAYVKAGEAITEDKIADLKKDKYILTGWNSKKGGNGIPITAETVPMADMVAYPVFAEAARVTFNVDGELTSVDVIKGGQIGGKLPESPTKDGYTFEGWNTSADGSGDAVTAETVVNKDMAVYAVFEEVVIPPEKAQVTFDVDGIKTTVEIVKGEAIGDKLPEAPVKDGYTFEGWNTSADGSKDVVTEETIADADMIVYAVFRKNESLIVPVIIDSIKAENGKATITLKDKPTQAPTLEDIKLQMNLNGTGNKDIEIESFRYDGDKTIYLTFKKVSQGTEQHKFTLTVTVGEKYAVSNEVVIAAKAAGSQDKTNTSEDKKKDIVKTSDTTQMGGLITVMLISLCTILGLTGYRKRKIMK